MKKEYLSVIGAILLSFMLLVSLWLRLVSITDVRAAFAGSLVAGVVSVLLWGFMPAILQKTRAYTRKYNLTDQQLKVQTIQLSNDIDFFVNERMQTEQLPNRDNWDESTRELIHHSQESLSLYHVRFNQRLADMHHEFELRKIIDSEFDRYYANPTNYIGMREVSHRLAVMAAYL